MGASIGISPGGIAVGPGDLAARSSDQHLAQPAAPRRQHMTVGQFCAGRSSTGTKVPKTLSLGSFR